MRITLLLLSLALGVVQSPSQVAFKIADPELIPEGIAYDPQTKTFFVGHRSLSLAIMLAAAALMFAAAVMRRRAS